MKKLEMIATLCVISLAILFAGCGSDTAAQLKQAQSDLSQAQAMTAAVEKERDTLRASMARCTKELEQSRGETQFFAKKVNPLERANFDKGMLIEKLQKELDELKKAGEQPQTGTDAAPAAPQAPTGDVLQ